MGPVGIPITSVYVCVCVKVERLLYRNADQLALNNQQRSVLDVASEFGHSSVSSFSLSTYLLTYSSVCVYLGYIDRKRLQCFDAVGWAAGRASGP